MIAHFIAPKTKAFPTQHMFNGSATTCGYQQMCQ